MILFSGQTRRSSPSSSPCERFADNVVELVEYIASVAPEQAKLEVVEWLTGVDITNKPRMREIACNTIGKKCANNFTVLILTETNMQFKHTMRMLSFTVIKYSNKIL